MANTHAAALWARKISYFAIALACTFLATTASAQTALVNGGAVGGTIVGTADVDTFSFSASAGENILLRTADINVDLFYPTLKLFAPNGTLVESVTAGAVDVVNTINHTATQSGTYLVEVADDDFYGESSGAYNVYFVRVPGANEGGSLPNGDFVSGSIGLGDIDSYTFEALPGENVILRSGDTTASPMYPTFLLYGPDGAFIDGVAGGAVDVVNTVFATIAEAGTYTVVIADDNFYGARTGTYDLYFARIAGAAEGGSLPNGEFVSGQVDLGDLDTYTFDAVAGDSIVLRTGDTSASVMNPILYLYGPDGALISAIAGGAVGVVNTIFATIDQTGAHTVLVADDNFYGARFGTYDLYFARLPGADDDGTLPNGGVVSGDIDIGDLDTFTFDAAVGQSIILRSADTSETVFYPMLRLYGPDGSLTASVAGGAVGVVNTIFATIEQHGRYTLLIGDDDFYGSMIGSYDLYFARMPGANEGGGLPVANGVAGEIGLGDLDTFRFFAAVGESVAITTTDVSAITFYPFLLLYGPNGDLVASVAGGAVDVVNTINYDIVDTGYYTVVVGDDDFYGATTGEYLLQLDVPVSICSGSVDSDGDSITDACDNCTSTANVEQTDIDGDGFGNGCDADFNNDCIVNVSDLGLLRAMFFSNDALTDLNVDGVVNVTDLGILRSLFFSLPGPSAFGSCGN